MTDPLNLREIERVCQAPECQACNMIQEANGTWTHHKNCIEATVLALVALVREARTLISELESVLSSEFQTRNNPCPEARATAWLARVQDEED